MLCHSNNRTPGKNTFWEIRKVKPHRNQEPRRQNPNLIFLKKKRRSTTAHCLTPRTDLSQLEPLSFLYSIVRDFPNRLYLSTLSRTNLSTLMRFLSFLSVVHFTNKWKSQQGKHKLLLPSKPCLLLYAFYPH